MSWWKRALIIVCAILLVLTLSLSGISFAASRLTDEPTLRSFVRDVTVTQGKSAEDADKKFDDLYFRDLSCSGVLGCISHPPKEGAAVVLTSKRGHDFFTQNNTLLIIFSLLFIVIILLIAESAGQRLKGIGIPFAIAGLNVLLKPLLQGFLVRAAPSDTSSYVKVLIDNIFTISTLYYACMLILGITLSIIGLVVTRREKNNQHIKQEVYPE